MESKWSLYSSSNLTCFKVSDESSTISQTLLRFSKILKSPIKIQRLCFFDLIILNQTPPLSYNKLAFRSASVQSKTSRPTFFFFFDNPFDSDVHHNTREKICHYFRFIAILTFGSSNKKVK